MSKTLTEQWREGTLEQRYYYVKYPGNGQKPFIEIELKNFLLDLVKVKDSDKIEVLAPVPSYRALYGPNDGNMTTGVFTVLKIIKENIENAQKRRSLTDLECGIKSQVVSLLKKWGVK